MFIVIRAFLSLSVAFPTSYERVSETRLPSRATRKIADNSRPFVIYEYENYSLATCSASYACFRFVIIIIIIIIRIRRSSFSTPCADELYT